MEKASKCILHHRPGVRGPYVAGAQCGSLRGLPIATVGKEFSCTLALSTTSTLISSTSQPFNRHTTLHSSDLRDRGETRMRVVMDYMKYKALPNLLP